MHVIAIGYLCGANSLCLLRTCGIRCIMEVMFSHALSLLIMLLALLGRSKRLTLSDDGISFIVNPTQIVIYHMHSIIILLPFFNQFIQNLSSIIEE